MIGYDVIAKACLRQGSFALGNRGIATTGGRSASAAQQSHLLRLPMGTHSNAIKKRGLNADLRVHYVDRMLLGHP